MSEQTNILSEPSIPIAPLTHVKARLGLSESTQHDAELARLSLGVTRAFEGATQRTIIRRQGATVVLDGCEIEPFKPIILTTTVPVLAVTTLHIDREASEPMDVVFDATTLISANDYRALHDQPMAHGWQPAVIGLRSTIQPNGYGLGNVQLVLDCGYTPHDGTQGWTLPANQRAVPDDIVEAFLQQISLIWKRNAESHLASKQFSAATGGGTVSFWSQKLAKSVKEILLPWATPEAALNLGDVMDGGAQA